MNAAAPTPLYEFTEWFLHNYPTDCILARPAWHAPKIYRAATFRLERQRDELAGALRAFVLVCDHGRPIDLIKLIGEECARARAVLAKVQS
jgi:hypothetical protein